MGGKIRLVRQPIQLVVDNFNACKSHDNIMVRRAFASKDEILAVEDQGIDRPFQYTRRKSMPSEAGRQKNSKGHIRGVAW